VAENSKISWTDDTLNHWIGCNQVRLVDVNGVSVPSECDGCYAMIQSRLHQYAGPGIELWGPPKTTPRHRTKYCERLMPKIDREAAATGRTLAFCYSLSDIFEHHEQLVPWRNEFIEWVERYTNIDYLFLTKRPQNVHRMVPGSWLRDWPKHVWLGTSAGTNLAMQRRAPYLAEAGAWGALTFVSMEPLLEDVDPTPALKAGARWFITGGESGYGSKDRKRIDMEMDWVRHARDTVKDAEQAFFHKQHGGAHPGGEALVDGRLWHEWPATELGPVGGVRSRGTLVSA
jgi:protein gp37